MTDMRMRPDPSQGYLGRTYRFYTGPKVFEFGHGLSYTNYSYKFVSVGTNSLVLNGTSFDRDGRKSVSSEQISVSKLGTDFCKRMKFSAQVKVTNHGEMAGKHPVLLFARSKNTGNGNPVRRLVGFRSVRLSSRKTKVVGFTINPCEHLSHAKEDGSLVMEKGTLYLGVVGEEHPINVVI